MATTYQLRPMSIGEIIDGAIAIFRRHFGTFLGIAIVCQGVPMALQIYIEVAGGILFHPFVGLVALLLGSVGGLVAAGATLRAISQAYLGSVPALDDALSYAIGKMVPLFIAGLVRMILIGLAALVFLIPGIVVACGYAVVAQVVVLEELRTPTDALGRSWALTKGYKGKALLLGIVGLAFVFMLPQLAAAFTAVLVPSLEVGLTAAGSVISVILYPIFACSFTLLYYDLRVRKEAFDLEHLSQQLQLR